MNKNSFFSIVIAMLLLCASSMRAQTIEGTEFWLTFGANFPERFYGSSITPPTLQIRIVSGNQQTNGTIYFSNLNYSFVFSIDARQVYTYTLTDEQMQAAINTAMGKTNNSIRIVTDNPVTAYAMNQCDGSTDATNILPVTVLGTNHYQISYIPGVTQYSQQLLDAYAVIAIQDGTNLYHNGIFVETLNAGEVYYRTSTIDMTGAYITANNPVAFFAVNQGPVIPHGQHSHPDCLMQQLPSVNTWGRNFFVPVSNRQREVVRIVASQDNTTITQTGGTLLSSPGSQSTYIIDAGQFIELSISLGNDGCYIRADKPIGVCTYLTVPEYNNIITGGAIFSDPSQCWVPAIEQTVTEALVAPFVPAGTTRIETHYALVITPTATKNDTRVSIGASAATVLSDGNWQDNATAGMSFYSMPLTDASYFFTNPEGLFVMCYGIGNYESYYFLAFSAMRLLETRFYANDVNYQYLQNHVFCTNEIVFRAEIDGLSSGAGSLKWFINGIEESAAQDNLKWNKNFTAGEYDIKIEAISVDGITTTLERTISIGVQASATVLPAGSGSVTGDGCYKTGETIELTAIPEEGYEFINWTENGNVISSEDTHSFTAAISSALVANFALITYDITVSAGEGGSVSGGGSNIPQGTSVTVTALPETGHDFVYWSENGVNVSTEAIYTFLASENRNLVANFREFFVVNVYVNNPEYGSVTGMGYYPSNTIVQIEAFATDCYRFVNWTINETVVSTDNPYVFTATDVDITANFQALDFDDYVSMLWYNTFMLNLKKLEEDGFEVIGCKWFKNGIEETNTRTIDEFSYSAGPNISDELEPAPTYYMFQLITKNFGTLCSTIKNIPYIPPPEEGAVSSLIAYPNPLPSGSQLTLEGVSPGSLIYVYDQSGVRINIIVAYDTVVTFTLPETAGVYLIRNGNNTIKVVVTN